MTPTTPSSDWTARLTIAVDAARAAGEIQRAGYQRAFDVAQKSSALDLVTSVDLACDARLRADLQAGEARAGLAPARLITEETYVEGDAFALDSAWIVDPLDGTTNFAHGFPHFAVSIAYAAQGRICAGVIYDPMRDEWFCAAAGHGATLTRGDGPPQPLDVRARKGVSGLDQALLATGFPYDLQQSPQDNMGLFLAFMNRCHGVRRAGSAALDLAYVAAGRLNGFWELRLSPWDVAAGALIVTEAGGATSDFSGAPLDFTARRMDILAAESDALRAQIQAVCAAPQDFFPSRYAHNPTGAALS